MPIYAYRCGDCGHSRDVLQKLSDPLLTVCPVCGAQAFTKQVTAAGFQLKGSGWYVTDFRDNGSGRKADAKADSQGDANGSGAGEGKVEASSDAKPDAGSGNASAAEGGSGGSGGSSGAAAAAAPAAAPAPAASSTSSTSSTSQP
jgi:putative FmdB family regulatory protein